MVLKLFNSYKCKNVSMFHNNELFSSQYKMLVKTSLKSAMFFFFSPEA